MNKTKGKYMTNDYIKQFLSDESLEALDESYGAQILFVKIPKYEEVKEKHDAGVAMFVEKSAMIDKRKKEIKEIDEKGFFAWVVGFAKLRKQRKTLESEIAEIDNEITEVLEETGVYYREMTPIRKEIDEFKARLRMFGLTLDDIYTEYFKIKMRLEREKIKSENAVSKTDVKEEPKTKETSIKSEAGNSDDKSQSQPS